MTTSTAAAPRALAPVDLETLRGRKRLLDAAWGLTAGALTIAVALLAATNLIQVRFSSFLPSVVGFAMVYCAASMWVERRREIWLLERWVVALQVLATAFLGMLWLQLGGIAVPAVSILFLLPIATSGLALSRWHPLASAVAALAVVGAVIGITSPDVRWYVDSLGIPVSGALGWFGARAAVLSESAVFGGSTGWDAAGTVVVFLVVAVSLSLLASRFSRAAVEADTAMSISTGAATAARDLTEALFEASPDPLALVDPHTGRVVRAGRSFSRRFGIDIEEARGGSFVDIVGFRLPDQVEPALAGGDVGPTPHTGGGSFGVSRVRVRPVAVGDTSTALVAMTDASVLHGLETALDSDPDPLLLIDADDRVEWLNAAARETFGAQGLGANASQLLDRPELPSGWWEPGPREVVTRPLEMNGRRMTAELRASRIPGTQRRITWIRVRSS